MRWDRDGDGGGSITPMFPSLPTPTPPSPSDALTLVLKVKKKKITKSNKRQRYACRFTAKGRMGRLLRARQLGSEVSKLVVIQRSSH